MNTLSIKDATRVWICPTDTVYGISARANDTDAIARIAQLKQRPDNMRYITLIADIAQISDMGIALSTQHEKFLRTIWPGPVSVIINDRAFRLPDYPELRKLIQNVGPIISTSANLHGEPTVTTIAQTRAIFGDSVDEYLDAGTLDNPPSTLIEILR